MTTKTAILFFVMLFFIASSQSASDYCYSEKVQGESCYKDCCESFGYSWGNGGCMVSDAEQDGIASLCSYCTDSYVDCMAQYESSGSTRSWSEGGCCPSAIILSAVGFAAFYSQRT